MDGYSSDHLYGRQGPSRDEQTREYEPPETSLSPGAWAALTAAAEPAAAEGGGGQQRQEWQQQQHQAGQGQPREVPPVGWQYDIWSLGVTWAELLLGTPHVFQVCSVLCGSAWWR